MNIIFRQVSVKERFPDWSKYFGKTLATITFSGSHGFMVIGENEPSEILEKRINGSFNYWLEEVELPTDEEICLKADLRCSPADSFHEKGFWIWGAKWLRDFVLAVGCLYINNN